ncbi:MAG TPA: hypothetical protein VGW33_00440 [Terriglobia bacterium]|nr:hypothetical protein [Terriglobia bacterium]
MTKQGNTLSADSTGALVPGVPFGCNVDGNVFPTIASCVSFLTQTSATAVGGVITENVPEHITTPVGGVGGLPWNPGTFSGVLRLGAGNDQTTCSPSTPNCWLTDVPIIIGPGMRIVGSGKVPGGTGVSSNGTGIAASSTFPAPLGKPMYPGTNLSCAVGASGTLSDGNYFVSIVKVNDLDSYAGPGTPLHVPGLSAESTPVTVNCAFATCHASSNCAITAASPGMAGTGFAAKDYRVFATLVGGLSGSETLQVPGSGMNCVSGGTVDSAHDCALGSTNGFTINTIQTNDAPNLVDLSNPLVAVIGGSGQSSGFWSVLENLTLVSTGSIGASTNPNVAYWNPTNQENTGINFVGFLGNFGSVATSAGGAGGGTWIYIGPHAPNSFVSHVQTDGSPGTDNTSPIIFYGMILDGRAPGATGGTTRVVSDSTFTPARTTSGSNATIPAGILVTGSTAVTAFNQVHVETPMGSHGTDSDFEVTNGASASVVGPTQFSDSSVPIVHLTSTGTAIMVKNVLGSTGTQVVKDDLNGVTSLGTYVANYSSSLQAGTLRAFTSLTLPNQSANFVYAGPALGSPATPAFRALVPADLPTGGSVQVLAAGQPNVSSGTNSVYVPWLGGGVNGMASKLSSMIASTATIADLYVGVSATYTIAVTFAVAKCTPSSMTNCTPSSDSSLSCTIAVGNEQCNDTTDSLMVSQGDEVFLHVTTGGSTVPNNNIFMSYRLTGVQ